MFFSEIFTDREFFLFVTQHTTPNQRTLYTSTPTVVLTYSRPTRPFSLDRVTTRQVTLSPHSWTRVQGARSSATASPSHRAHLLRIRERAESGLGLRVPFLPRTAGGYTSWDGRTGHWYPTSSRKIQRGLRSTRTSPNQHSGCSLLALLRACAHFAPVCRLWVRVTMVAPRSKYL